MFVLLAAFALCAPAQVPQNPSPMVEHTRTHPRLREATPEGRRETLELGTLFIPGKASGRRAMPLIVALHCGTWLPEVAAAQYGRAAVMAIQAGSGSAVYARTFADAARFGKLLREAEAKAGVRFESVSLVSWSAGYGAVREILSQPQYYGMVGRLLLIDGLHTGYTPERRLETDGLDVFLRFARDAVAGRKQMIVTHSEIFPGTFASTTETADYLLESLNLRRKPVLKWGPMGTQQLSETRAGRFLLVGYAGNAAPDHVDQLHSLGDYLRWFR